ncbi:MAG: hypothetical protein PHI34_09715 [Acidobacteriota bacterium]|nr:hypothetical protein [Acidobacteriota bacterium]
MDHNPESVYEARLTRFQADLAGLRRRDIGLGAAKLLIALAGLAFLYRVAVAGAGLPAFAAALVLFLAASIWHGSVLREKKRLRALIEIQAGERKALRDLFPDAEDGAEYEDSDHPFASDFDLFGFHGLFHALNRTATKPGRDRLAALLRDPGRRPLAEDILARQAAVADLAGRLDLRHGLRLHGREMAANARRDPDLGAFLDDPFHYLNRPVSRILAVLLPVLTVGAAAGLFFGLPRFVLYAGLLVNMIVLLAAEKRRSRTYALVSKTHSVLRAYAGILEDIERTEFDSERLRGLRDGLFRAGEPASQSIRRLAGLIGGLEFRTAQVVYLAVDWLVLWDIQVLIRLERWRREHAASVPGWFRAIAEFEALSSLANHAFNHPDWAYPSFPDGPFQMTFTAAGNPLLPARGRVDNDFALDDRLRLALVTGPNMAGKSTFLKTIGMNLVLAYAGGPVCAHSLTMTPRRVAASLKVNDSLDRGLSLFHAELRRLKEILDPAQAGEPVFFLIDEMLKGTNAADRQAGSLALLRQMAKLDTAGLVATHDLQLAGLAGEFPDRARNYHFDGRVEGNELLFDFILRPGPCRSFNALALMRKMGIEV